MNSRFRFPHRVRIHGGECGAVARALHHEAQKGALTQNELSLNSDECVLLSQADLGKASGSTFNERKQMSTKTSIKRIALVAVSALGFGVLTAVAPANSAGQTASTVAIGAATSFRTGATNIIPVTVSFPSGYGSSDTMTINAQITAAPTQGGNANAASLLGTGSSSSANAAGAQLYLTTNAYGTAISNVENTTSTLNADVADGYAAVGQLKSGEGLQDGAGRVAAASLSITPTSSTVSTKTIYLVVKPDLSGSYGVMVSTNATGRTYYVAGDPSATATFATTGGVSSLTLEAMNTSPVGTGDSNNGVLIKATLKDSAGSVTNLGSLDSLKFTSNSTSDSFQTFQGATGSWASMTGDTATRSDFINGVGWFRVKNSGSADVTTTITVSGSGTLSNTVTGSVSAKFLALGDEGAAGDNTVTASVSAVSGYSGSYGDSPVYRPSTATSTTVKYTFAAATAAAGALGLTIADTGKKIFGSATPVAITYRIAVAYAAGAASVSATVAHAALSTSSLTITPETAAASAIGTSSGAGQLFTGRVAGTGGGTNTFTVTPSAVTVAEKGTITLTAVLKDEFKVAIPSASVSVSVAGRNVKSATSYVTDASGAITYTYTDAGTASSSDVVSFTSTVGTTTQKDITVTYSSATASTITITGGNTTAGVTSSTKSAKDIDAGGDGASTTTHSMVATVKDASGNLLVGVPVTWTISGTTAAVISTTKTTYTGADGKATAYVYGWAAGDYTVTATSGAKSATAEITFAQTGAGEERTISAAITGNVLTATAKDRYGNPVPGVTIYVSRSGGVTVNSKTRDSATTDSKGNAEFIIAGTGSLTVSTISYSAAVGTKGSGQTCARKGAVDCNDAAADDTTFTATTVGTALKAETGIGASFDAAGVATVQVTSAVSDAAATAADAAADAAAEAIDAANAATDAANLAAEAADAATVAAEEARDAAEAATAAVEELATQVATLMAALKAQITTLANTVAKIAKKVKA